MHFSPSSLPTLSRARSPLPFGHVHFASPLSVVSSTPLQQLRCFPPGRNRAHAAAPTARNLVPPSASTSGRRQSPDRAAQLLPRPRASLQRSLLWHLRPASSAAVLRPLVPLRPQHPWPGSSAADPRRSPRRRSSEPTTAGYRARRLLAPAPDGWIKLNTDGSFVGRDSSGGAGFVARDSEGLFVFTGASSCPGVDPLYSELWPSERR
uniref:RNase H type-1 domain-containing protein n=1 Tax=Ananas comosus var. bracteatus TaxID=296719 RepID=A0A6V7PPK7_ANACO|nr:unnamed protein product [Ananas comosus var. bracteatus]